MLAFMTFVEANGKYLGGYLGTDNELVPLEFCITDPIDPPTKLQKILLGVQFEFKWFGDLIAGSLYKAATDTQGTTEKKIDAIFVSHKGMLPLRRKTGNVPVVYVAADTTLQSYENYKQDIELVVPLVTKLHEYSNFQEVFERIEDAIQECPDSKADINATRTGTS